MNPMATGKLHQLELTITSATFNPSGASARTNADIYIELTIDGKKGKKTEIISGTLSPVWDEHFDILVKPNSVLLLYAFHHSKWRKDVLLGQSFIKLDEVLRTHSGKLQDTSLTLDLVDFSKGTKLGDISVILSGMTVDQNTLAVETTTTVTTVPRNVALPSALPSALPLTLPVIPPAQPVSSGPNSILPPTYTTFAPLLSFPSSIAWQQPPRTGSAQQPMQVLLPSFPSGFQRMQSGFIVPVSANSGSGFFLAQIRPVSTLPVAVLRHPTPLQAHPNAAMPCVRATLPSVRANNETPPSSVPAPPVQPLIVDIPVFSGASVDAARSTLSELDLEPPRQEPSVADLQVSVGTTTASSALPQAQCSSALTDLMSFEVSSQVLPQRPTVEEFLESLSESGGSQTTSSVDTVDPHASTQPASTENLNSDHEDVDEHAVDREAQLDENDGNTVLSDAQSSRGSSASPSSVSSQHQLPSLNQDEDTLPPGWERRIDQCNRVYYVDHNTRTTTWQRPSTNLINSIHNFELSRHDRDSQLVSIAARFLPNALLGDRDGGRLPEGWERRLNNQGTPYFYNASTETTMLDDPRINSLLREDPLPDGWEMRISDGGVVYFYNHQTKEQTYRDPRGRDPKCSKNPSGIPFSHEHSFSWKLSQFRELCASNAVEGHAKIHISRENLFQDSYRQIMRIQTADLKRKMHIAFRGEDGLDYGGVAREWFLLLSLEMLHPILGLFQYVNDRNCTMQISVSSGVDPNHLEYFRFIGRFIALALFHGMFIGSSFCLPFYKKMLNKRLVLNDIETVDVEVYNSLKWIRDTNLDENDMPEMYFATDFEILGRVEHFELKPGGSNIPVTEQNKHEYIILMIDWMFSRGIEKQTESFLVGFNEVLPLKWLQCFDEMELELMLCGMQEIDVDDWCKNTVYKHYSKTSKQIVWFWKFVQESSNEDKMRLLQFVTGTCRIPVGGFAQLMGSTDLQKFCVEKVGKEGSLPRSHTCFNRLDLPPYKSYEQLAQKLRFAIHETHGFGIE